MSTEWDFAGFRPEDFEERIEKELVMCEVCGEVLAPADQLAWLVDRLGAASFANPTLAMFAGVSLGYVEEGQVECELEEVCRASWICEQTLRGRQSALIGQRVSIPSMCACCALW